MSSNLGPWTTSLSVGWRLELSAFWRARMSRLPALAGGRAGVSIRAGVFLACAGLSLAVAPLVIDVRPLAAVVLAAADGQEAEEKMPRPPSEKILQALRTSATVEFFELTLTDAIQSLTKNHNIVINFDNDALEAAKIALDRKTVYLRIGGVSFRAVLDRLLEPESLGYIVDGDELIVTTRELADSRIEETVYDLRDAARSGASLSELRDVIVNTSIQKGGSSKRAPHNCASKARNSLCDSVPMFSAKFNAS